MCPLGICGVEGLKIFSSSFIAGVGTVEGSGVESDARRGKEIGCIDEVSRKEMKRLVIGSRLEAQRLYWERFVGYTISLAPLSASLVLWYRTICLRPFKAKRRDEKKKLANDTPHNPDARSSPRLYIYQSSEWLIPLLNASIIPPVQHIRISHWVSAAR